MLTALAIGLALFSAGLVLYLLVRWSRPGFALASLRGVLVGIPVYANDDDARLAAVLTPILRESFLVVVLLTPLLSWLSSPQTQQEVLVLGGWLAAACLGQYVLLWSGRARWAGRLYPATIFAVITLAIILGGAAQSVVLGAYVLVIVSAGLLLGGRAAVWSALVCVVMVAGFWLLREAGVLAEPARSENLSEQTIMRIGVFLFAASLLRQAARRMDEALAEARRLRRLEADHSRSLGQSLDAERKRSRQTELLNDFARTITGLSDPQLLTDEAVRRLAQAFGFEAAAVYLVEDVALIPRSRHGLFADSAAAAAPVPEGQGLIGWVGRSGETCWVTDTRSDSRYVSWPGVELACVVAVPLRLARIVVGVLVVGSQRPGAFEAADVRTLESLADLLVAALQTGQLFAQLRSRQQMTEALRRIGAAVNATLELPTVLTTICAETRQAFSADRVEVWLEADNALEWGRAAEAGLPLGDTPGDGHPANGHEPPGEQVARAAAGDRVLFTAVNTPAGRLFPPPFALAQSLLLAPLRKDGRAFGALVIAEKDRPARFTAEDAASAEALGAQMAATVDNARNYAAHRRRADDLALINDITRTALEISDLDHLLQALADRLGGLIGADGCYLTLWDAARQVAEPATASNDLRALYLEVKPAPPNNQPSLTEAALRAGAAVPVADVRASPYFQPEVAARFPTRSVLGVPLVAGDQPLGAALIAFNLPHEFTADEISTAEQAGRQIALALARAQALAAARRRHGELESLRRASLQVTSSLELKPVLSEILRQTLTLAGASDAHLFFFENDRLTFGAALWATADDQQSFQSVRKGGLTDTVARTGHRLVIPDVDRHPLYANWRWGGAIVGLPLKIGSSVRGVMNVAFERPRAFDEHELRVLELLADQAAIALENARLFEAERRRAVQLALLSEVSQQVTDTLDESVLLQRVVDAMVNRLGYAEAAVLLPAGGDDLEVVALAKTVVMAADVGFRQKVGQGVIGRAAEIRQTYVAPDIGQDPYYFDPAGRSQGSAIGLPLLRKDELLGILYLETDQTDAFTPADVVAFETLAQHVATALQNARLYAHARNRLRDVLALQSVSEAVVASLELDRIIANVVALLHESIGYRYVSLYVLDGDLLRLKAQVGYPEELIIESIPVSRGVSGRAVRTRQTQFIPDVTADPDFLQALYEVRSEICVPLLKDDMVLGTLNIESGLAHALTVDDVNLLTALGGQVTVALINARLFEAEREQRSLNETLRAASVALSASLDFDTVLDRLLVHLEGVVPYDGASVMLVDAGQAWVARHRGYEVFGPEALAEIVSVRWEVASTANLARMVTTGQPVIIADTAADPAWQRLPHVPEYRSWMGAPAIAQGEVLACFSLGRHQPGAYDAVHAARLAIFAGQAALALQNAKLFAGQQRRSEEQRLLLSAARDLSAGLSQEAVLRATARHMTAALRSAGCAVSLWERDRDRVVTLFDYASHDSSQVDVVGSVYDLSAYPLTRRVLEERVPVITRVTDPLADPAEAELLKQFGHVTGIMAPLFTGERVLGLIEAQRDAGDPPFTESDLQLAQSLAAQAAVALENARLHAAVQENLRERDALLEASGALLSTLELDLLLQNILRAAINAIPRAEKGTIILAEAHRLQVRAAQGYENPRVSHLEFELGQGYTGQALRENRPLLISNASQGPMVLPLGEVPEMDAIRSAIVAPLTPKGAAGAALGVISLDAMAEAAFSAADLRVLETFANTAAIAIDNARLHAEVQRLAVTDSLTGLANPRAFEQSLATEFHRAGRYGYALSLVIMDIDSFKQYNDTFGHPAGNERLKAIAGILRANVRDPDLPVRYGGEEFALLLPHTNKAGALALAERIREAAEVSAPAHLSRGQPLPGYSLSLGVASFPIDALTADQLLLAADNAELAAKRGGKNRVIAAAPLPQAFRVT